MDKKCPIYIVGGDTQGRKQLVKRLRARGYHLTPFASGGDFLDAVHYLAAGIALIELKLSDGDGLAVIEELNFVRRDIPVIATSPCANVRTAVEAIKRGADDFLERPFTDETLIQLLTNMASVLTERIAAEARRKAASSSLHKLTKREAEVMTALWNNNDNSHVAHELHLSIRTVEAYRTKIIKKLGVKRFADTILLLSGAEGSHNKMRSR